MINLVDITVKPNEDNTSYCPDNWHFVEQLVVKLGGRPGGTCQQDVDFLYANGIVLGAHGKRLRPFSSLDEIEHMSFVFESEHDEMIFRLKYL